MIGSMWRWDHSHDWPVIDGRMAGTGSGNFLIIFCN